MMMISYEQALKLILKDANTLCTQVITIDLAQGRVVKENIYSSVNMPPFNKSAVDGFAVRHIDVRICPAKLKCIGIIQAGKLFKGTVRRGECVKIMTGAPLPKGTDSVIMVEDTQQDKNIVTIFKLASKLENICLRGEDIKKGQRVLSRGALISSSEIALLASIGKARVKVVRSPTVCVLNTGGEIVSVGDKLGKNKIFNSNGPMLCSLLNEDGIKAIFLGVAEDKPVPLRQAFARGLKADILLVSGGVSMGDYDLVPSELKRSGVKEVFHKVNIKPGKPLFFGKKANTLVFGIPGNPVSNFLTYQLFIRPTLYKMSGHSSYWPKFENGILEVSFKQKTGRTHFVLVVAKKVRNCWHINPVSCHGSADVFALSKANGFMVVDKNVSCLRPKSEVKFLLWKERLII